MRWPACLLLMVTAVPGFAGPRTEVSFQQRVAGYTGAIDTELWEVTPHKSLDGNGTMTVDGLNNGGRSHVLIRFTGVVGRVPRGATVHRAGLTVTAFDPGSPVHLHRALVPWPRGATWAGMIHGVAADGRELSRQRDGFTFGKLMNNRQRIVFDVTDTVQAWVNGAKNYGWGFINTGTNGWDFYSSETEDVTARPKLIIEYSTRDAAKERK